MKALLLIDIQNDFLPTGALPVPEGDQVIAIANRLLPHFDLSIATQDWHPPTHGSFAAKHRGTKPGDTITLAGLPQILWPTHCVQNSPGAQLAPGLDTRRLAHITQNGADPDYDSYSGFFDNGHRRATDLHAFLSARGVTELYFLGLATDYCVAFTALDAVELGYRVQLVEDGCRGVNLKAGDVDQALVEMRRRGVVRVDSSAITSA